MENKKINLLLKIVSQTLDFEKGKIHYNQSGELGAGFYSRDNYIAETWEELKLVVEAFRFDFNEIVKVVYQNEDSYKRRGVKNLGDVPLLEEE